MNSPLGITVNGKTVLGAFPAWPDALSPITATPFPGGIGLHITPSSAIGGGASGITSVVSKVRHTFAGPCEGIEALFHWWYALGTNGEFAMENGATIKAWFRDSDGVDHPFEFYQWIVPQDDDEEAYTTATFTPTASATFDPANSKCLVQARIEGIEIYAGYLGHVITEVTVTDAAHYVTGGIRLLSATNADNYPEMAEGMIEGPYTANVTDIPTSGQLGGYGPLCIMGAGKHRGVAILGDSIFAGTGSSAIRQNNDGVAYRMTSGQLGYTFDADSMPAAGIIMLAKGGESLHEAVDYTTFKWRRAALAASGARSAVWNYATNDIATRSEAQIKADLATFTKQITDLGILSVHCALGPRASSTDGWTTVANQSPIAVEATRLSLKLYQLGALRDDCIANGSPADLVQVIHPFGAIAVDAAGSQDDFGPYFKPAGSLVLSATITSTQSLTTSSFRSSALAALPVNQYRGYALVFTSGAAAGQVATIRYHLANGGVGITTLDDTPANGDSFEIYDFLGTVDGTHHAGPAMRLAAQSFNPLILVGVPYPSEAPSPSPDWNPADYDRYWEFDATLNDSLSQDASSSVAVADGDPVGAWADQAGRWPSLAVTQSTSANRPTWGDDGKLTFDGSNDSLRWVLATTVNGAASSADQTLASAAGLQIGDHLYFQTAATTRQIINIAGNVVTLNATISTTNGENVRRTIPQGSTMFMVVRVLSVSANAAIVSGAAGVNERWQVQMSVSGVIQVNAGSTVGTGINISGGDLHLLSFVIDGVNSRAYFDGAFVQTFSPGSNSLSGLTFGGNNAGSPSNLANIDLRYFLIVQGVLGANSAAQDAAMLSAYNTYFKARWPEI